MSNPFFLTRQTANLMEDFVRELKADASLFLLYGKIGVGKTRLLEELKRTRLTDSKIHWIDLKAGGSGDGSLVDSGAMVEDIFARAQPGDIIIADHFEMALQKTRHQLFLSWSIEGIDKQINMIVSSNDKFFEELRQLATQYQVRVQSSQLMTLKPEETVAFLGFYLFPDRPIGKLSVPPILQEQLGATHGAIGKIVEIAERAGDQITTAALDDVETIRKDSKNMIAILIGVALVIGCGWYYLSSRSTTDDVAIATNETLAPLEATAPIEVVVQDESASLPATAPSVADGIEPGDTVAGDIVVEADASTGEASVEPVTVEAAVTDAGPDVTEEASEDSTEVMPEAGTASVEEAVLVDEANSQLTESPAVAEADEVPVEPTSGETVATVPEAVPIPPPGASRFDSELQASLDWINRSDKKVGTIQIMMLSYDKFDDRVYYDYVDHLATRGVDTSELKTFMTFTGGRKVYSVVYGEYKSWRAAGDAIQGLPSVLRDTSPIPRSAGGLLKEIRRLEAEN
ncbi:MAG: hypothetical protein GY875_25115 [Gammaproteobacteria bacterium]|nr:hypothetical protein [Gammaproteobacteria bacterium]